MTNSNIYLVIVLLAFLASRESVGTSQGRDDAWPGFTTATAELAASALEFEVSVNLFCSQETFWPLANDSANNQFVVHQVLCPVHFLDDGQLTCLQALLSP